MSTPCHEIVHPTPKPKPNPGQVRLFDTADDRLEIARLLSYLPSLKRVDFLQWVCDQAFLGNNANTGPSSKTRQLAANASQGDAADSKLTIDCLMDICGLCFTHALDLPKVLAELVRQVRALR